MKFARPSVRPIAVGELVQKFGIKSEKLDQKITGISHSTKSLEKNDLFVALAGQNNHGASFVNDAIKQGATAILTDFKASELLKDLPISVLIHENPRHILGELSSFIFGEPSKKLNVFGITGTNGKTTTAWLLKAGLENCGIKTGLLGTAGISIPGLDIASERTTPEAPELQSLLALAVEKGAQAISMEVSSHSIKLERINGTLFKAVGFTNLSQDHLDFHGNMQDYFQTKASLFNEKFSSKAFVTTNDQWGQNLNNLIKISHESLGGDVTNDWRVVDITAALGHVDFTLQNKKKQNFQVNLAFAGAFNAFNAALAIAMGNELDVDLYKFIKGIESVQIPGRMQPVVLPNSPLGIVDYAHSPEAIENVLSSLKKQTKGKLVVVVGAGGNRDKEKRPQMGKACSDFADWVIITDDNPRDEDPSRIRKSIISGIKNLDNVIEIDSRKEAIKKAVEIANDLDTIAVLGKGHETYQEIKGQTYTFNDFEILRELIQNKRGE